MTTTTANPNNRIRKTLASQLDRLDDILDTLANGLTEAVTTTVRDAVSDAVRDAVKLAIIEIVTSPELQEVLRATQQQKAEQIEVPVATLVKPGIGERLWGALKATGKKIAGMMTWTCNRVRNGLSSCWTALKKLTLKVSQQVVTMVKGIGNWLTLVGRFAWQLRKPLLIAFGIGSVVGLGCYFAGPVVSSAVSGIAGFVGSLAASAVNGLRRMLDGLNFANA